MFLKDPLRTVGDNIIPRITYDPRCRNAIKEHGLYHYPDNARKRVEANPTERPVDVDNHALDATRYGYFNYFPELFNMQPEGVTHEYADMNQLIPNIEQVVSLGHEY